MLLESEQEAICSILMFSHNENIMGRQLVLLTLVGEGTTDSLSAQPYHKPRAAPAGHLQLLAGITACFLCLVS